jgi:Cyclic nucleotide-binding domain
MSTIEQRRDQMFPKLGPEEIERLHRFGEVRRYKAGDFLFVTGEPSPGMFVLIAGSVAVSARDGLGHVVPLGQHEPGEFLAEVGHLSGRPRACRRASGDRSGSASHSTRRAAQAHHRRSRTRREDHACADFTPGRTERVETDKAIRNAFLFIGADPATSWLRDCGIGLDGKGFVSTGSQAKWPEGNGRRPLPLESNVPGVFAVGVVRSGSIKRVGGAIGEGAAAVAQLHSYLAAKGSQGPPPPV